MKGSWSEKDSQKGRKKHRIILNWAWGFRKARTLGGEKSRARSLLGKKTHQEELSKSGGKVDIVP